MLHRITTQIGTVETDKGVIAPAVSAYLAAAGVAVDPTSRAVPDWSAALIAWAARADGVDVPEAPSEPASWLAWGGPLAQPQTGSVAVMTDGAGRKMLLGVVARVQGSKVYVVGAYDGTVQMRAVELGRVVSARRPPIPGSVPLPIVDQPATATAQQAPVVVPLPAPVAVQPAHEVSVAALQTLLDAVRGEFADVHARIDTVASTAIADIQVKD